jgi:glycosyltransferase involved in cell wall biosynthesis
MKKILIFSLSYYPTHVGGAEIAIKEITDRISPNDIAFHLICNRYDTALPKEEKVGNVRVHRIGLGKKGADTRATSSMLFYAVKMLYAPLAAAKALSLNRRERFDGLWAMMLYMTFPISLMRLCGVRLPYALTLQEGDPFEHVFGRPHIRPLVPLLRYGVRHASAVQAISSFLGKWPKQLGYTGTVEVIPNGVDVARFSKSVGDDVKTATRAELGANGGDTVLVHTGRMVEKNGIADIIRALAFLSSDIRFAQIGAGPDGETLRALAGEIGVADRVRFLGFVPQTELPRYLQSADIFVRPSRSEGMGNSFIEAFAAGVSVIATQVGGIADFLFDPERDPGKEPTGRAVAPHDAQGIARAALLYLEDEDMQRRIVANARALAARAYDWNGIVRAMRERVFSRILGI